MKRYQNGPFEGREDPDSPNGIGDPNEEKGAK